MGAGVIGIRKPRRENSSPAGVLRLSKRKVASFELRGTRNNSRLAPRNSRLTQYMSSMPGPLAAFLSFLGASAIRASRGQEQGRHAGGILQCGAGDLGGVDDTGLDHVFVDVGRGVVAVVALGFGDLLADDAAILTGVGGNRGQRGTAGTKDDVVANLLIVAQIAQASPQCWLASKATPPPGRMPSSTAARVACRASSTRAFFSFISLSVAAPTLTLATPPASFARRSSSFSRS